MKSFKLLIALVAVMVGITTAPATASGGASTRKMTRPMGPAITVFGTYEVPGVIGSLPPLSGSTDNVPYYELPEDMSALTVSTFTDGRSGKTAGDKDKKRMEIRINSPSQGEEILKVQSKETERGKGEDFRYTGRLSVVIGRNKFPLGEITQVLVNVENDQNLPAMIIRRINMTYAEIQFHKMQAQRIQQGLPPLAPPANIRQPQNAVPNGAPQFPMMGGVPLQPQALPQPLPQQPQFPAYVGGTVGGGGPRMPQPGVPGFPIIGNPQTPNAPAEQQARPPDEPFRKEPFQLQQRLPNSTDQPSGTRRLNTGSVAPAPAGDNFNPDKEPDLRTRQQPTAIQPRLPVVPRQATRPAPQGNTDTSMTQPVRSNTQVAQQPVSGSRFTQSAQPVSPERLGPPSIDLVINLQRKKAVDVLVHIYVNEQFIKTVNIIAEESSYTTVVPAGELKVRLAPSVAPGWSIDKKSAQLTAAGTTTPWQVTLKEK